MTSRRKRLERVRAMSPAAPAPGRRALIRIGRVFPARTRDRLALRFGPGTAAEEIAGTKALLAALGGGAGALLGGGGARGSAATAILVFGGWRWPEVQRDRRARARHRAVLASLPNTLDLLAACARAGASVGRAFGLAASRDPGPLGDAMREAVRALEHGIPRAQAYTILCDRADVPEVRTVVAALRRAERLGTSVAATLTDLAADMRARRRALAEEQARAAPVRMLIPVFVCFLPAFGLLTIVPVIVVALRGFRGA